MTQVCRRGPSLWGQWFLACLVQGKHPGLVIIGVLIGVITVNVIG